MIADQELIIVKVPIGVTAHRFQYDGSFTVPLPDVGKSEPVWDSLIPSSLSHRQCLRDSVIIDTDGLGYVKDTPLTGGNISVIAAFHQLHCLVSSFKSLSYITETYLTLTRRQYTLRRAYYSTSDGGEDFDLGFDRTMHVGHCFEYLKQSIVCDADSTLEPPEDPGQSFEGWDFQRQCRDYDQLKEWSAEWRAFDGHGFLAHPVHRHDP